MTDETPEATQTAIAKPALKAALGSSVMPIVPSSLDEVFRLATAIAKSGLAPNNMKTPEALTIAIMHGMEIGLLPMQAIQKIAVVNGRPTIWGDALPALLWSRGFRLVETCANNVATCTVIRPDGTEIERSFTEGDAKKAGLWEKPGPWKQYPARMLQMRARGYACRDGAADVLSGLYISEELEEMKDVTPRKSSYAAKKDGTDKRFQEIMDRIAKSANEDDCRQVKDEFGQDWEAMPRAWKDLLDESYEDKLQEFFTQMEPEVEAAA